MASLEKNNIDIVTSAKDFAMQHALKYQGPLPLMQFKRNAAKHFTTLSIPDRVKHIWRFSEPLHFMAVGYRDDNKISEQYISADNQDLDNIIIVGKNASKSKLSDELIRAGIEVLPFEQATSYWPKIGSLVPPQHGFFEAMNAATFRHGVVIRVPAQTTVQEPVRIQISPTESYESTRVLVVVEQGARCSFVEEQTGGGLGSVLHHVLELFVEEHASVSYHFLQTLSLPTNAHSTVRAQLDSGAELHSVFTGFGGNSVKIDLGVILNGEQARSTIQGVNLAHGKQHMDYHTEHVHAKGYTNSDMNIKGVLGNKAYSAYTGLIRIEKAAAYCEAYQDNRNLLLSNRAKAVTIPELEILNSEVRCSHGATAAPMDEEQLFYLQSRGMDESSAKRLLVTGFLQELLVELPQSMQQSIIAMVEERLEHIIG